MAEFTEIGRQTVSPARDIVISKVCENGFIIGYHIGSFVRTAKYTGHAKGGTYVPAENVAEFKTLVNATL
jgi:hypothetical protein